MKKNKQNLVVILVGYLIVCLWGSTIYAQDNTSQQVQPNTPAENQNNTPPAAQENPPATPENPPAAQENPPATPENPPAAQENPPATPENPPVQVPLVNTNVTSQENTTQSLQQVQPANEGEEDLYQDVDQTQNKQLVQSEQTENEVSLTQSKQTKWPFRNSIFTYENTFSVISLARDSELTYNPYYAMSYDFKPRWYFTDHFYTRFRLVLEQELTDADTTTHYQEPILSDSLLDFYYRDFWVDERYTGIKFTASVRFTLPTSLAAQSRTQWLGIGPGVELSRTFDILAGLTLLYDFRFHKYINEYATAQLDSPVTSCIPGMDGDCGRFVNQGTRNPSWRFDNTLELGLDILKEFHFTMDVIFYHYLLYPVSDVNVCEDLPNGVVTSSENCELASDDNNTNLRTNIWYIFEFSYDVLPWLNLALGTSTLNPQLTPDSEYRAPFFNRYTNFYFDVNITVDELVNAFTGNTTSDEPRMERISLR